MSGSGWQIGMMMVIMAILHAQTLWVPHPANIEFGAAGRGTTAVATSAPLIAAGTIPLMRTATSGSVALARCLEF